MQDGSGMLLQGNLVGGIRAASPSPYGPPVYPQQQPQQPQAHLMSASPHPTMPHMAASPHAPVQSASPGIPRYFLPPQGSIPVVKKLPPGAKPVAMPMNFANGPVQAPFNMPGQFPPPVAPVIGNHNLYTSNTPTQHPPLQQSLSFVAQRKMQGTPSRVPRQSFSSTPYRGNSSGVPDQVTGA